MASSVGAWIAVSRRSASKAASRASSDLASRRAGGRRRSRSIARFRAVVVIHAPGLSGTPRAGHVSRAVMKASWTASSARSKSPSDADERRDRPSRLLAEQAIDDLVGGLGGRSSDDRRADGRSGQSAASAARLVRRHRPRSPRSAGPRWQPSPGARDHRRVARSPRRGRPPRRGRSRRAPPWSRRTGRPSRASCRRRRGPSSRSRSGGAPRRPRSASRSRRWAVNASYSADSAGHRLLGRGVGRLRRVDQERVLHRSIAPSVVGRTTRPVSSRRTGTPPDSTGVRNRPAEAAASGSAAPLGLGRAAGDLLGEQRPPGRRRSPGARRRASADHRPGTPRSFALRGRSIRSVSAGPVALRVRTRTSA